MRENLKEVLGRSPDSNEVYHKLAHRPKGSRASKAKKQEGTSKSEESAGPESTEGDGQDESVQKSSERLCTQDGGQHSKVVIGQKVVICMAFVINCVGELVQKNMDCKLWYLS